MSDISTTQTPTDSGDFDPLLECLVIITELKQRPYSAASLKSGLPMEGNMTPELFVRAAERAGLTTKLMRRPIRKISRLVLPVVMILEDNSACVLTGINKDDTIEVIFPEVSDGVKVMPMSELDEQYAGYVFFIQARYEYESRALENQSFDLEGKHWFWGTILRYKGMYTEVMFASLFINIFALATPLFIMNVYDRVVPNNAVHTLWVLALGVLIVFCFDFLLRTLRGYYIDLAGKKIDIILASQLFQQLLNIKMLERPESTGVQANHVREFEHIRDFFTSATISSIVDIPFIFLFIWIIWIVGGKLAFVPILAVPIVVIMGILLSIPMNRAVAGSFVGGSQKNAMLIETLTNIEVVKSNSAEGSMLSRWEKYVGMSARAALQSRFYSTMASNITTVMNYIVTVSVVVWGVYLIGQQDLTVGGLIACTILSGRALAPLGQVTNLLTRWQLSRYSLQALNRVMDTPIERPPKHKFLHRPSFEGDIEFEEIHFKFPAQEIELFKGISFEIKAKEKVGVIGSMGAGKTTLLKLILGFYPPQAGAVRIDGTDLEQIDPADLRKHLGYVPQDPKLFFGTVRDNIAMKTPWATDEEVLAAAKISGADRFINRHPAGYDMPIGEGGQGLSGGQCQAITIARAIMGRPNFLLLDEPTSGMDSSSEQLFINHMRQYSKNKTLLLVTHKMSLLALVDRLIVLQNGVIAVDGPKDKVLASLRQLADKE